MARTETTVTVTSWTTAVTAVTLYVNIVSVMAYSDTLQLVSMLYRHGDRAPAHSFPNNPVPESVWPQGFGSLTQLSRQQDQQLLLAFYSVLAKLAGSRPSKEEGMRQHHALGKYMRERYRGFINESYYVKQIRIRSTDVDRTLMSAESHLSGLYPPSGKEVWSPAIPWQPIPIHTVPAEEDNLLQLLAYCPRATYLYNSKFKSPPVVAFTKRHQLLSSLALCPRSMKLRNDKFLSPETIAFTKKHQVLFDYLTKHSGMEVNVSNTYMIRDAFFCQNVHGYKAPAWYNNSIKAQVDVVEKYEFSFRFSSVESTRFSGGSLLKEITRNMLNKSDGIDTDSKIFMYSAHDDTVGAFISTLGAFDHVHPPYTATVIVELHDITFYRTQLNSE